MEGQIILTSAVSGNKLWTISVQFPIQLDKDWGNRHGVPVAKFHFRCGSPHVFDEFVDLEGAVFLADVTCADVIIAVYQRVAKFVNAFDYRSSLRDTNEKELATGTRRWRKEFRTTVARSFFNSPEGYEHLPFTELDMAAVFILQAVAGERRQTQCTKHHRTPIRFRSWERVDEALPQCTTVPRWHTEYFIEEWLRVNGVIVEELEEILDNYPWHNYFD